MLYQPQLPRPQPVQRAKKWDDIWNGFTTLSKQNQNLVQYLQNYLTQVYNWLVPPKVNVSMALPPYTVNGTDAFIYSAGGTIQLPATSGSGRVITIKNLDMGSVAVVITPTGTDTIDGQPTYALGPLYEVISLVDATAGQWMIY